MCQFPLNHLAIFRLEDVENCFRDMACSESENLEETQQFNNNIEKNVRNIREGIADSEDVKEIKQTIESRLKAYNEKKV